HAQRLSVSARAWPCSSAARQRPAAGAGTRRTWTRSAWSDRRVLVYRDQVVAGRTLMRILTRVLRWLGIVFGPGGDSHFDPFAGRLAPVKKGPPLRSGSVAVAEPDDD